MKRAKRWWILLLILVIAAALFLLLRPEELYGVDSEGMLHAPLRTELHATRKLMIVDDEMSQFHITYESQNARIYGDLYVPKNSSGRGMLLLPGGGVGKKDEMKTAQAFARRGYVVLTIDQRGVGETGGPFYGIDEDYALFKSGRVPTNHLLILDALAGLQFLREQPEVEGKLLLAGESMGGRAAMVAARMSGDISGLLVISSAGFGRPTLPSEQQRFLDSFDPDANVEKISVPVLFLHSTNDTTIPLENARSTYDRVTASKRFLTVDGCPHGYCAQMESQLDGGLVWLESS